VTSSELAEFVARVRVLFRGEMDEEIFALAKQRIAGLRLSVCLAALDDYALIYGGSRGKFIPAKFFEFYAKKTTTEETAPATKREKAVARELALDVESQRVSEDWDRLREDLRRLNPRRRDEIANYLGSARGRPFPPAVEDWSRVELLAVHDIATGRGVEEVDWETVTTGEPGGRSRPNFDSSRLIDPREFWGSVFGDRRIRAGTVLVGTGLERSGPAERLQANPCAVSRDAQAVDRDEFEIPF